MAIATSPFAPPAFAGHRLVHFEVQQASPSFWASFVGLAAHSVEIRPRLRAAYAYRPPRTFGAIGTPFQPPPRVLTDVKGIPLGLKLTDANVHDTRMLEAVVHAVPPIHQCWGPLRSDPRKLHADHHCRYRQELSRSDIRLAFSTVAAALIVWRFIERWVHETRLYFRSSNR